MEGIKEMSKKAKVKEKKIKEEGMEDLMTEPVFLDEDDHKELILSLEQMRSAQLKAENFQKAIQIKRLGLQITQTQVNAEIKELNLRAQHDQEKAEAIRAKYNKLVRDLTEKYDLPDKWAYDETTGEISIIEIEEQEES